MKALHLTIFLCGVAGTARGQASADFPIDKLTRRISYAAVVPMAGSSQADLQTRALAWASSLPAADQPPTVAAETVTGVVTVYGVQPFVYAYEMEKSTAQQPHHFTIRMVLHYTARLALREGRYRYELTDFTLEHPLAKPPEPTRWPAENDLIEMHPVNITGSNMLAAERKAFAEATAKLQKQLKEKMAHAAPLPAAGQ